MHVVLTFNMLELNSEDIIWQDIFQTGLYQDKMIVDANYDTLAQCFNSWNMNYSHSIAEKIISDN